jgi:hypothetical protein
VQYESLGSESIAVARTGAKSRWPIHSCSVRIGTPAAAMRVPKVWRRSWVREDEVVVAAQPRSPVMGVELGEQPVGDRHRARRAA